MKDGLFEIWRRLYLALMILFAVQGLTWTLFATFDPSGTWDARMALAVTGAPLDAQAEAVRAYLAAIFGAVDCALFVVLAVLVAIPFKRREVWAWNTVFWASLLWFAMDSTASVAHGYAFNAYAVNVPLILVLLGPLVAMRPGFRPRPPATP